MVKSKIDYKSTNVYYKLHNRGITLIELVATIAMIGIIATLAVPNMTDFTDRWILRSTAHMIASDIRRMQSMAVKECDKYNFELNEELSFYRTKNAAPNTDPIKKVNFDSRISKVETNLPYAQHYGPSLTRYKILTFSYLGIPNQGGTITLTTKRGNSMYITIMLNTGRVLVYE